MAFSLVRPMARISKIPREELHVSKPTWWLESRFHFSFADYCHPKKDGFGALFVLNDDIVQPRAGFGAHPHRNAEIFTYVLDGELSHQDSMGNKEPLERGAVQYLSAGSGIVHSEMNEGHTQCRFLQVWIKPDKGGVTPQYGSQRHEKAERHNHWLHILGGTGRIPSWEDVQGPSAIRLHQDCNVLVTEIDPDWTGNVALCPRRRMYLVCMEGSVKVNEETELLARDALEVVSTEEKMPLRLASGASGAHLMAIEMAA